MRENEMSMHEYIKRYFHARNEHLAIKIFVDNYSMLKLCTAQFPMNISVAKKSSQGQNYHFSCMEIFMF